MPDKLCIKCHEKSRKVSKSGKTLTMCEDCQRADWRKRKRETYGYLPQDNGGVTFRGKEVKIQHGPNAHRKCKSCKETKPLTAFGSYGSRKRTICKQCESDKKPKFEKTSIRLMSKPDHILLVNDDEIILAKVVSQKTGVSNKSLLIDIYREQGYHIEHVYESEVT